MGLAIDGNVVHGLAVSGQSFQPLTQGGNSSYSINGKDYYPYDSDNDCFKIGNKSYYVSEYFYFTSDMTASIQSGIDIKNVTLSSGSKYLIVNYDSGDITLYLPPYDSQTDYGYLVTYPPSSLSGYGRIVKNND